MSAGGPLVDDDLEALAPGFRAAIKAAIRDCRATGLDAVVFEANRSAELQALYYARGRTIIPPEQPVTNAKSNLYSWHGYGLAVDVISQSRRWFAPRKIASKDPVALLAEKRRADAEGERWFAQVAEIFKARGCDWGGDWKQKDYPHFQWGTLKPTPSTKARELIAQGGMEAVWQAVGAA